MLRIKHTFYEPAVVEIFKTNVECLQQANHLLTLLHKKFPLLKINFDLHDCDKILRVEGENILNERIIEIIHSSGYQCIALE